MSAALLLLSDIGIGGSERKSVRIANTLRLEGHDIRLAYLNAPHTLRESIDSAVPVLHLDRKGKFSFRALQRLKRYLDEQRIACVACVNLYPLLYAHAAAWQLGKRAPAVSALINATDFRTSRDEWQMMIYAPLLRRTKHLIFGCRLQQDKWTPRYHLPLLNSRVIYNGVDQAHFNTAAVVESREELRQRHGLPSEAFVAVSVSQLRPEKQQSHLVRSVAALVSKGLPIHAVLVGDGPERAAIERCIVELGVTKNVRLFGAIDDVRPLLKLADVFVLTSTAVETFSNAALEAMSMGLPVILSRIGGAAEMVSTNESGFLYPPSDIAALTNHLGALATNVALTRSMGEAARIRVRECFSFAEMIDQYRELLFPPENSIKANASVTLHGI